MALTPNPARAQLTLLDSDLSALYETEMQTYSQLPRTGEWVEYDGEYRMVVAVLHIPHSQDAAIVPMLFCRPATEQESLMFGLND